MTAVSDPRRGVGDRVKNLADGRPHDRSRRLRATVARGARARGPGLAGERLKVVALGVIEPQRVGERREDALGHPGETAALHPDVIVDRHARQHRDLLTSQSGDSAIASVCREPGFRRGDPSPPGAQELPDLGAQVDGRHGFNVGRAGGSVGGPAGTRNERDSRHPLR